MEYSIRELSRLSGVSTRTLRWYDQIGLLKPGRVAESGYRYYSPAQVDRLQDILFTGPSGWSWPGSRLAWTTPLSSAWPPCKRAGRGWRR